MLKHLYIFLLCCSWATLFAQEPFRYTTKDGLPSNHIYDFQEDADGFMWIATNRGLVKFDGENFKTFTLQDGLPNNDTWEIELDAQNRLWYFSKSAYQGYIIKDSIYTFSTENKAVLYPHNRMNTEEGMWIYSTGKIFKFDEQKFNVIKEMNRDYYVSVPTNAQKDFQNINFRYFTNPVSQQFAFWDSQNVYIYDWDLHFQVKIPQDIPKEFLNAKASLYNVTFQNIGCVATEFGVLFIDFNHLKTQYFPYPQKFAHFKVKSLKDKILVSIPNHLYVFNYDLELIKTYDLKEYKNNKEYKDNIGSYLDANGNLWLNSFADGITYIPNIQQQSQYLLKGEKVQKLEAYNNQIYAGIYGKGIYQFNPQNQLFFLKHKIPNPSFKDIYHIRYDSIHQAALPNEAVFENNQIRENIFLEPFPSVGIMSTYASKDYISYKGYDYYLFGAIYKVKPNDTIAQYVLSKEGLYAATIYQDQLLIGGIDGLYQLKNDQLIRPSSKDSLTVSVLDFLVTEDELFIATDGRGIYTYDQENIKHLKNSDNLSVQRIRKNKDTLWLATQAGVKKLLLNVEDIEKSTIIDAFYQADGLLQNNTNDILLQGSLLYVASDIGISRINLNNPYYKEIPKLYFKSKTDTLTFKGEERDNILISFAGLDFHNQEYLQFKYRLIPQQQEWAETTTQTLNFANLSPGFYTLEVEVTNQHKVSNLQKIYLKVIPYWWETTWAKIGFVILGVLIIGCIIWLIIKQQAKKIKAREALNTKISGLELQALRSQMNPHFIHNSLNAIQYYIQRNEVELSENYLSKFSQLIRLFFEYSRRQNITIAEELDLLASYLEIEKLRFEEKLQYKIEISEDIDREEQLIPSMLLQPIVENAVNHGIFHKPHGGFVNIIVKYVDDSTFKVKVEDDGIGINKSKRIFKASSKNYQSNSSAVLNERLDLLNKSNDWKIEYHIVDRSEIDNLLSGTLVTLIFKKLN